MTHYTISRSVKQQWLYIFCTNSVIRKGPITNLETESISATHITRIYQGKTYTLLQMCHLHLHDVA